MIGKTVTVRLTHCFITGTVVANDGEWLTVEADVYHVAKGRRQPTRYTVRHAQVLAP